MQVLPIVVLFYAVLLPPEIRVTFAEQTIYPHRAALIGLLPWLVFNLFKGRLNFGIIDFLVLCGCSWMVVSITLYHGFGSFASGVVNAFDTFVPYLIGRLSIRNLTDLRRVLVFVAPGVFVVGLSLMAEALSRTQIVRPAAASVFGRLPAFDGNVIVNEARDDFRDYRLGMLRATGPFPHPILAGVFMVSLLPLYFSAGIRGWPRWSGLSGAALGFFTISSTTLLGMLFFFVLTAYDRLQRMVGFLTWKMFIIVSVGIALTLQLVTQNGLVAFVVRSSLNPQSARYRELIWEYGVVSVQKHPWIGIGYDDYERLPWMIPSVDAAWLFMAIRNGLVTPIFLFTAFVAALFAVMLANRGRTEADRILLVGLAISLFTVIVSGFTVAFFGGTQAYIFALVGLAVTLGHRAGAGRSRVARARAMRPVMLRHGMQA